MASPISPPRASTSRTHLGYRVPAYSNKGSFDADFGGGMSGLDAGVTRTYDNAVEFICFHPVRPSLVPAQFFIIVTSNPDISRA
jgi:hypothetical protein